MREKHAVNVRSAFTLNVRSAFKRRRAPKVQEVHWGAVSLLFVCLFRVFCLS